PKRMALTNRFHWHKLFRDIHLNYKKLFKNRQKTVFLLKIIPPAPFYSPITPYFPQNIRREQDR
ncbi:hypothetical protein ED312_14920, partial [Sinomicrobium pectinilyticum]